jgi:ribonucleoside-diphosphate reductase alpha chain
MHAVKEDRDWNFNAVTDGTPIRSIRARDLWLQIAEASWE